MEKNDSKHKSEKDREPPSKKKIIIAIFLISFAFLGSYLIYFILQVSLRTQTPMVVVVSGSMEPTIHSGDILWGIEVNEDTELNVGDIVAYTNPISPIGQSAHRIFKIDGNTYYIVGDNPDKKRIDVIQKELINYKIIGISYS